MLKAEPGFLHVEIQPLVQGDGPSLRFVHGAESHPGCIYSSHPARSLSYRISELEGTLGVILPLVYHIFGFKGDKKLKKKTKQEWRDQYSVPSILLRKIMM